MTTRLRAGDVHVWRADLDREIALEHARSLLSDDERARADRFLVPRAGRRFAIARALLRTLLADQLGARPRELAFAYGPRGKPRLEGASLRFNVSHSRGLGLLAFALDVEVGVDLEGERAVPDALSIAERMFAPPERSALAAVPEAERVPAFLRCWTRKEAYVKATGDGLHAPLDAFEVSFATAGEPARFVSVRGCPEDAQPFRLANVPVGPGYWAALCVEGRVGSVLLRDVADPPFAG